MTAYSTLEEDVFIAPCVVTTNDNFMGRTERRHELVKGPTIRRGARVGGGAVICPGVEIGEEAFIGAGAVVTKDVPPRMVAVGVPARTIRPVAGGRAALEHRAELADRRLRDRAHDEDRLVRAGRLEVAKRARQVVRRQSGRCRRRAAA